MIGAVSTAHASRIVADVACGPLLPGIEDALERHHLPSRVAMCRLRRHSDVGLLSAAVVLLVGTRTSDGTTSVIAVEQIRDTDPRLAIYVCTLSALLYSEGPRSCEFVRSGADDVVTLADRPKFDRFAQLIGARLCAPPPERELRLIAEHLPRSLESAIALHCARNAFRRERETDVAKRFGISVQTINDRLRSARQPSMGLWMRSGLHLHDRELGRRGIRSRADVTRLLNAQSPSALRAHFRRAARGLRDSGHRGRYLLGLLDPNA